MERQLLFLFNYEMRFSEADAIACFAPLMSDVANEASTRASAISKVAKAGKARADAQKQQIRLTSTSPMHIEPTSTLSASSSTLASKVRSLTRRISLAHISSDANETRQELAVPLMPDYRRSLSASSSSDASSLTDDNGSSSGSSSGWMSDSDMDEPVLVDEPKIYRESSHYGHPRYIDENTTVRDNVTKKPFILRPAPGRAHLVSDRSRKTSDTSSVITVTASEPNASTLSLAPSSPSSARAVESVPWSTSSSLTTSSVSMMCSRSSATSSTSSVSFLSHMWGVITKTQTAGPTDRHRMRSCSRSTMGNLGGTEI